MGRLRRAFKKIGRAMGGPITAAVDAGRAVKDGKGAKGAAKAFGRAAKPGASVGELHDAHTEAASAAVGAVAGRAAGGRVRDLGRIFKPKIKVADPTQRFERTNEMIASAADGHWRRAGRMLGSLATSKPMEAIEENLDRGQALGDIFDDPSEPLDGQLRPMLERIFRQSLDYDAILTKPGRPAFGSDTSATTFPGVIYLGNRSQQMLGPGGVVSTLNTSDGNIALPDDVFVHELVHLWEYQNGGPNYLAEATLGYAVHGFDESYRWWNFTEFNKRQRIAGAPSVKNQGRRWRHMPAEPKAEFIQNAYQFNAFDDFTFRIRNLRLVIDSTMLAGDDAASYARAFGVGVPVDWTGLLTRAVRDLHAGNV